MHAKAQAIPTLHRRIVWSLLGLCALLTVLYVFLVGETVFSAVARKTADAASAKEMTTLGTLETQYLALNDQITPEYAKARGFAVDAPAQFVARASDGRALTFNTR
jgi:hypothetical protein